GSRGHAIAARYVAAQFEGAGLEPAGDDGTYFQRVELRSAKVDETKSSVTIGDKTLVNRKDFILGPYFGADDATVDAPVIFAGFGAEQDYEGIDAHGKIVLILSGARPQLPNDERAYYSSREYKRGLAVSHGAAGMIS